jgi:PAS domain S-box-containing protein
MPRGGLPVVAQTSPRNVRRPAEVRRGERSIAEARRIAHIGSWERDLATGVLRWSDESCWILGIEPCAFAGTLEAFIGSVHPDDRERVALAKLTIVAGPPTESEYRIIRPDGAIRTIHERTEVIRDASRTAVRSVGSIQDVTEQVTSEAERTRLASAVEQTADAIWMQDVDNIVVYVNPAFTRVYGYEADEIVGHYAGLTDSGRHEPAFFSKLWASVAAGRTWTGSIVNRCKDGSVVEVEAVISALHDVDGRLIGYIQTDRDVTRERELESTLRQNARERDAIVSALARIDPNASAEEIASAACAEINKLPGVDSTWAAAISGDTGVVLATAGDMVTGFGPGRVIPAARVAYVRDRAAGGPWFEAWRTRPEDGTWATSVAATGLRAMAYAPLRGPDGIVGIVGIGCHDPATELILVEHVPALATFASLLGAMLAPKLAGRHRDAEGRSAIKAILQASAFRPFFQPIVELGSGDVVGYEALTRFSDGRPPDLAFAAAGRVGLGLELERATMAAALAAADVLHPGAYLSLNASPELILSGAMPGLLKGQTRPIVLEITEHVPIDDYPALRSQLDALRPAVGLAVDDAGAGFASFRHILELAPDYVKLDTGLIRGIDHDPSREALAAGMAYFATKRDVKLIAEGIETLAEMRALRGLAVNYGQGYLFGRPRDGADPGQWPSRITRGARRTT